VTRLRVALLQLVSAGRDRDANLAKGEAFCRRAAASGADVALLPELWSIGYAGFDADAPADAEAWRSLALDRDEAWVRHFASLARALEMAIAIPYLERWPGAPRNAVTLFDRHGRPALHYAKVHLAPWGPPDAACTPGDTFPVATLDTAAGAVAVGAMICFDRELPEPARLLALGGAELLLVPNACDLDDRASGWGDVRLAQLRARAFENGVAVALANYAAPQHDGHSAAFLPDGGTVAQADAEERIVLADLDLARVRDWRRREALRPAARRPELYAAITAPVAASCYEIRRARAEDVARLPSIERAAARRFDGIEPGVALASESAPADLAAAQRAGLLFVAVAGDEPVGFAKAERLGGDLHLEEIDVLPAHGRRGLGRRLVAAVIDRARALGAPAVSLVTFRDVAWNATFYARLGFETIRPDALPPALRARMETEARRGLGPERRVAMRLPLDSRPAGRALG
jgi:predicted amidohydrolase/predicted N-acetyltransferase YhbS